MDADTARLDPDRVAGWFTFVWGQSSPQTFNVRLAGLRKAFGYWREQRWLADDPLTRLRARPVARDDSRALTRAPIAELLGLDVTLRERVLWQMLYETAARAEELLMLDVPHLDTANRLAVVTRKGGAKDVVVGRPAPPDCCPECWPGAVPDRCSSPIARPARRSRHWTSTRPQVGPGCPTAARPNCSTPIPPVSTAGRSRCTNCGTAH